MLFLGIISFVALYVAVFFLIVLLEHRKRLYDDPKPKRYPTISILVPAYNEEKNIEACINSLLHLDYPKKPRIIVVNDGSIDKTRKICERYSKKRLITLVNKPNGGKASALNAGLKKVKTELVACIDADSIVSKKALHYMVGYFEDTNVAAVTPALKVLEPGNTIQKVQWIEYLVNLLQRKLYALLDIIYVTPGPFSVYRTEILRKIGFDEQNLTEDMEVALHIQDLGYKIENSVHAEVHTLSPMNLYILFNQRIRWYRGLVQNLKTYQHMLFSKKHGLLGRFILPLTIITVIVSIIGAFLAMQAISENLWNALKQLYFMLTIGFANFQLDFVQFIFSQNLFIILITGFVLLTTFIVIYLSHRLSGERFSWTMKLAYAVYIAIYFLLIASVWFVSLFKEFTGAARRW